MNINRFPMQMNQILFDVFKLRIKYSELRNQLSLLITFELITTESEFSQVAKDLFWSSFQYDLLTISRNRWKAQLDLAIIRSSFMTNK